MDNELKKLKQIYLKQSISDEAVEEMWQQLKPRLPVRQYHPYHDVSRFAFMTLCAVVLALGSVVGVAQATKPDDTLYPVKVLTDRVVAKTTGIYHAIIKQKAHEAITSENSDKKQTMQEPTATVTKTPEAEKADNKTSGSSSDNENSTQEKTDENKESQENSTNQNNNSSNSEKGDANGVVKGAQSEKQNDNPSEENKQNAAAKETGSQNPNNGEHGENQNRGNSEKKTTN